MATRIIVWGSGDEYLSIEGTLGRLVERGQAELVGFVSDSLPDRGYIAGIPIYTESDLAKVAFDLLVVCQTTGIDDSVAEMCSRWGVERDKVVPSTPFLLPGFDLNDYLELRRSNISLICNLCWGGILAKTLGLPYLSPFRSLFIHDDDYLRLLGDLRRYVTEEELEFDRMDVDDQGTTYPVMLLGDVRIHFNHVATPDQACAEWEKRKERINWDNLFVEMHTSNPESERAFNALEQYPKRICFVGHATRLPHSLTVPPDGIDAALYERVNQTARIGHMSYLYDPVALLLGKEGFRRYTPYPPAAMPQDDGAGLAVKTSVIIPVYNTEAYLPACLDSVLAQTQRELEVILVDDGSTDGSLAIEREYAARDPRVRVIQQPNLRQGTARNRGLAEARGEYIYFMDSDDLITPELFETCYEMAKAECLDFVTFDSAGFVDDPDVERPELFGEMCDRAGAVTTDVVDGPEFWRRYFKDGMTPFLCWLEYFDRRFLLDNGLQFVERIYFEDNDWIVRVFMAAKRIRYLPAKLHRYRERPGSNVHSGFTPVLADSCFDVHDILTELAFIQEDPALVEMLQDVSNVKDIRFRQFAEIDPNEHLRNRIAAFGAMASAACCDRSLPFAVRTMHLNGLLSLARGVRDWPDVELPSARTLAEALYLEGMPSPEDAPRIGIYGTGKACRAFLAIFDMNARECFFLDTAEPDEPEFFGCPHLRIDRAAALCLDAVIVTSAKFADEMKAEVARCLGADMPVYVVPRSILGLYNSGAFQFVGEAEAR